MPKASCPSANELQDFVSGGATAKRRALIMKHFDECRLCVGIVGELMAPDSVASPEDVLRERFELIREIGRGGTSMVFEARPRDVTAACERVAIKLLHGTHTRLLERFDCREAPLAVRAGMHPAFVRVYEVIKLANNRRAIVMELLEGCDLETYATSEGALPLFDALDILAKLAEAVAWLDSQEIVHRDLSCRNVFLSYVDNCRRVRVLDLGFARGGATLITGPGTVLGTPGYMAPEQLRGQSVGKPADVWALAMISVRLFTGTCAIDVSKRAKLKSGSTWRRLAAVVPVELASLIERSLSQDSSARPRAQDWVRVTNRLLEKRAHRLC